MSALKEYKLSDFIEINPKVTLGKGAKHSFVEMKDLNESQKYVLPSQMRELKGGARFQDGDTLFARITPCLENGKICQVKGLRSGVGYGSTEFLVFRGKRNISNTDFIYYLSRYDVVRRFAEQNMVGTSGRQRVSKEAFENISLLLPDLPTQTAIAEILSSLDDKIELNNQINQELEALAQAIFKHWFIDFEFPITAAEAAAMAKPELEGKPYKSSGGEMVESELGEIPKGWNVRSLSDLAKISKENVKPFEEPEELFFHYSIPAFDSGMAPLREIGESIKSSKFKVSNGVVLVSKLNPRFPRVWPVLYAEQRSICSTEFQVIRPAKAEYYEFIYSLCKSQRFTEQLISKASGTSGSHQRVKPTDMLETRIATSSDKLIKVYHEVVGPSIELMSNNLKESLELTALRDSLLPKLISGSIELKL